MAHLSKKERTRLNKIKKAERRASQTHGARVSAETHSWGTFIWIGLGVGLLALFVWAIGSKETSSLLPKEPVHWHIPISYEFCGEVFTPTEKQNHSLVHGHSDGQAHVEGKIRQERSITLGKFMDNIGLNFSKDTVYTYTNGDQCPESQRPGKVEVFVNQKLDTEFRDHVLKDGENIKITFN